MKQGIHPNYHEINVTCSCGNKFVTKSFFAFKPSETFLSDGLNFLSSTECHILPNTQ